MIIFVQVVTGVLQLVLLYIAAFVLIENYGWMLVYVYINEDVITLSQPYLLLALSSSVRNAVRQQLLGKSGKPELNTAPASNIIHSSRRGSRVAVIGHR
jgi:hypothetical protein